MLQTDTDHHRDKDRLHSRTDAYFLRTREIIEHFGDCEVTYAIFMRVPVLVAADPALKIVQDYCPHVHINRIFRDKSGKTVHNVEGNYVPARKKIIEITGPFSQLIALETLILQRIGWASATAYHCWRMCSSLPDTAFIDMSARHLTGDDMACLIAYGARIGTYRARQDKGAKGFIGSSTSLTAPFYDRAKGIGTIPHALVGYAKARIQSGLDPHLSHNPAVRSLQMFAASPAIDEAEALIALVDYDGCEISDALAAAEWFYYSSQLADRLAFGIRLDTHGERFAEGLDYVSSVRILEEHLQVGGEYEIVRYIMGDESSEIDRDDLIKDRVRKVLFAQGVSAASIIAMRQALDKAGYTQACLIVSSGFDIEKCMIMRAARAPITMIGTGSFFPQSAKKTFATADIISYDGSSIVKIGREFLLPNSLS